MEPETTKPRPLSHIPNVGFLLVDNDKGQVYFRLFSYARYLNQRNLDESYIDAFGNTQTVPLRQDIQLQKFFAPFSGWFLTPKMRYYLYVWSSNASQGDPAQVVGAGNLTWVFNRFVSVGVGITSLPTVRSTEGQFPYWLGVDDRLIADEFFRGSYTSGVWLKGELHTKVKYQVMIANNLSTLGVSAAQIDNKMDTQVRLGPYGCRRPASSACGTRSATTTITRRSRRGSACTTATASRKSKASREPRASRTARSGSPTAASSSRRICSDPASPSTKWTTGCRASTPASSTRACRSRASTTGAG